MMQELWLLPANPLGKDFWQETHQMGNNKNKTEKKKPKPKPSSCYG